MQHDYVLLALLILFLLRSVSFSTLHLLVDVCQMVLSVLIVVLSAWFQLAVFSVSSVWLFSMRHIDALSPGALHIRQTTAGGGTSDDCWSFQFALPRCHHICQIGFLVHQGAFP